MEQNAIMLIGAAGFAGLAVLFSIIAVATPGWGIESISVFQCTGLAECKYFTATGVLLIISIVVIAVALLLIVLFLRGILNHETDRIKAIVLALIFIGEIFIVSAYSSPQHAAGNVHYSYHLAVAAGIFTYISTILFAYYAGHASILIGAR